MKEEIDFAQDVERYNKLMRQAYRVNEMRDKMDRKAGFATPYDCNLSLTLKTIMQAIQTGIICEDWEVIAEAQAMLQVVEKRERKNGN